MKPSTKPAPKFKNRDDGTVAMMYKVTALLIPGIVAMVWFFGVNVLVQIALAIITAIVVEAAIIHIRKRDILAHVFDGSAILTAVLLAISIPSIAPWWVIVIGVTLAVIFGKHLYGGLGNNIFNPAMLGFVILIISFPKQMTLWSQANFHDALSIGQQIQLVFSTNVSSAAQSTIDALTGATPLDGLDRALSKGEKADVYLSDVRHAQSSNAWLIINLAFLAGGLLLWAMRLISMYIPLAYLAGLSLMAMIFHAAAPDAFAPLLFHLFSGATMLGAFFIATDPVSASTTPLGRWIYGFCIGVLLYLIRAYGSFHDAVAFAVLFMNMMVPLIDAYTIPKTTQRKS